MLATRFSGRSRVTLDQRGNVLSVDDMRQVVPSIFAEAPHASRSDRYAYIPTSTVIDQLQGEGWAPTFAVQAKPRDDARFGFAKHMIRLRRITAAAHTSDAPELVLINSHDGTTGYQLLGGYFRALCCNGLVVGSNMAEVRVRHTGEVITDVVNGAAALLNHFETITERVQTMKALTLHPAEQHAFARSALPLRFEEPDHVATADVLRPKRRGDDGADLWSTFNRVQEHMVRGGVRMEAPDALRRQRSRAVNGIAENVHLNRALWTLADEMARLKRDGGDLRDAA